MATTNADEEIKKSKRDRYIYENKSSILGIIGLVVVVLLLVIYFVWSTSSDEPSTSLDVPLDGI